MKRFFFITTLLFVSVVSFILIGWRTGDETIIKLPITFEDGYGSFWPGFAILSGRQLQPSNPWYNTESQVTGIPKHWNNAVKNMIWFDGRQFAYQNYKQGNLSSDFFNELKISWKIDLTKRTYLDQPIKCFTYIIYGKDTDGKIKYKIDTNNNLDFSDESEYSPSTFNWDKVDSLAKHCAHVVQYESYRNGKIVALTAPILILEKDGALLRNFAQHGTAEFNNTKIIIASEGFTSTDYTSVSIVVANQGKQNSEVTQNEIIPIGNNFYKSLGVNMDKRLLMLKKMPRDTVIYSPQVGFNAKPFKASEFTTKKEISLEMYKGKFLFLEFWGSWCGPCIKELPKLKNAYDNIDKSKIDFLGIAVNDQAEALTKILQKKEIKWQQILLEREEGIVDDYNVQGYPTSFLISPTGKILAKNIQGEKLLDSLNYYLSHN